MILGQTPPCQKKDGVNQANLEWFEDVEAYCQSFIDDSAASMPKPKVLTTAQARVYRHSVQDEPDYVSEYRAALNAFVLSWQVNVKALGPHMRLGQRYSPTEHTAHLKSSCRTRIKTFISHLHRHIHFGDVVEVHVFEEQCVNQVPKITIGTFDLKAWNSKPWGLYGPQRRCSQVECRFQPHVSDLWCAASDARPLTPPTEKCRLLDDHLSHTVNQEGFADPGPLDQDFQDTLVFLEEEEDLRYYVASVSPQEETLTLEMYGLIITHHSVRVTTTSQSRY